MNIWKLTYSKIDHHEILLGVVIALNPKQAREQFVKALSALRIINVEESTIICQQLGTAASNFQSPEIVSMQYKYINN